MNRDIMSAWHMPGREARRNEPGSRYPEAVIFGCILLNAAMKSFRVIVEEKEWAGRWQNK